MSLKRLKRAGVSAATVCGHICMYAVREKGPKATKDQRAFTSSHAGSSCAPVSQCTSTSPTVCLLADNWPPSLPRRLVPCTVLAAFTFMPPVSMMLMVPLCLLYCLCYPWPFASPELCAVHPSAVDLIWHWVSARLLSQCFSEWCWFCARVG